MTRPKSDDYVRLTGTLLDRVRRAWHGRERGKEFGARLVPGGSTDAARSTRALSMDTVFSHVPEGARVDYVKMDVEGVEARLLSGPAAAWLARVDAISLQVHDPYTLDDCACDLRAQGFTPRVDPRRRDYIVGVRTAT